MKTFLFFISILLYFNSTSQVVLNNGVFINVNGGISSSPSYLVLNNPPLPATAAPIVKIGTSSSSGGLILESEWNKLQYNLGVLTYPITIPYVSYATGSWVQFPLNFVVNTSGTVQPGNNAVIRFSSQHATTLLSGYDNLTYTPSLVANMNGGSPCSSTNTNNSINAIDRFWIIEPINYRANSNPAVTLDFTYIMSETDVNGGNVTNLASTLQPQRFDTLSTTTVACAWNGFPTTSQEFGTNTVAAITPTSVGSLNGVQVSALQFFPVWTLASYLNPLPVKIISFSGVCENKGIALKWTSAEEVNSAYYTIEKSFDGINFTNLSTVPAAGNSNHTITYSYNDLSVTDNNTCYYRLSETDKNGAREIFQITTVKNCLSALNESAEIYSFANEVTINLLSLSKQNITVTAYDVSGRLIYQKQVFASEGNNSIKLYPDISQGIYLFELKTEKLSVVKRILIER